MSPEHEDARARQIEALRRYVAQLRTQRERVTGLGVQQDHPESEPAQGLAVFADGLCLRCWRVSRAVSLSWWSW